MPNKVREGLIIWGEAMAEAEADANRKAAQGR